MEQKNEEFINITEDNLSAYDNFTAESFAAATKMLEEEKVKRKADNISGEILDQVISDHKKFNFPFFKYVKFIILF